MKTKPKSTVTSLRLSESEMDRVQTYASEHNIPIREVLMLGVKAALDGRIKWDERGYEQGRREGKKAAVTEFREALREFWEKVDSAWGKR
jgi:hypothetical protein